MDISTLIINRDFSEKDIKAGGVYFLNKQDHNGNTPLHIAFLYRNIPAIYTLLTYKAQKDIKNNNGKLPGEEIEKNENNYPPELNTVCKLFFLNFIVPTSNHSLCIRHSETLQNALRRTSKNKKIKIFDSSLTDIGIKNAQFVGYWINQANLLEYFDEVVSSPLTRALETTRIITSGCKNIIVDNRIREKIGKNSCTGLSKNFLQGEYPTWSFNMPEEWWYNTGNNNDCDIQNNEPENVIIERGQSFLKDIRGKKVLFVSHGGFMRLLFGSKKKNLEGIIL